jgi:hypothetical protein
MRQSIITTTLAAALFSSAAFAQKPSQGTTATPDFSGIWSHPSVPGFEPLPSGPTSLVNRSRRNGVGNTNQLVGDYSNPILKPLAAEVVRKRGEIELSGRMAPNPSNQCWPGGVPYIFWNKGIQLLQQPEKITLLYFYDHEFRQVRLNQLHPAQVTPSWYGHSVGHYEGDTLVIDTVGVKIGPFAMVDVYGTPHSPSLHVVERYRLLDYETAKEGYERDAKENARTPANDLGPAADLDYRGKVLQLLFTVEDEGVFTMPWSATITYRRGLGEFLEIPCAENTHQYYGGKDTAVPQAAKPDF